MASISWQNATSGNWTTATGWTSQALPGPIDDVTIDAPGSYTVTLNAAEAIGSLAIGSNGAVIALTGGSATLDVTNDLANTGTLAIDSGAAGDGGSSVSVGGTLSNTGTILLGPTDGSLAASVTIATGALVNTGSIALAGGTGTGTTPSPAVLTVAAEATGPLTGGYDLRGDSRVQFSGGAVTGIASGASLRESGTAALVALASGTTTNSALYALGSIAGTLDLEDGASIGMSGSLAVTGTLDLDTTSGAGGSALRMDGTLNNTGLIAIGPNDLTLGGNDTLTAAGLLNTGDVDLFGGQGASPAQARLGLSGAAPAALTGTFDLAGDALLQFASGAITSIAVGAAVRERDASAVVATNSSLTTNSALAVLASIAGELDLDDGASVTTQASLAVAGTLDLDDSGVGGSSVAIAGTLSNSGTILVGPSGSALTASDSITASGLANTGAITLNGGDGADQPQASLILRAPAPATLTGGMSLIGNALLQFASGAITAIGDGADLAISGDAARVAVASATTTNSALSGLDSIAGELDLDSGTSLSLAGDLAVSGRLLLDSFDSAALSTVDIGGTLTNSGAVFVGPNTGAPGGGATASALVNTGQLVLRGSGTTEALLTIEGAAPTSLTGVYVLFADSGVQFAAGGVAAIASGAFVAEDASGAGIALAGAPGGNSALTGLANVAGNLDLADGAQLTTSTDLTVTGGVAVDTAPGSGGSDVTLGGTLLNTGIVALGAADGSLGAGATITASALVNSGTIGLVGGTSAAAMLRISGTASNTGLLVIGDGATLDLANSGVVTQTAGTATIAGTLAGALALEGGVVIGDGVITGSVEETGGTLVAGLSTLEPGPLAIAGPFGVGGSGVLRIGLGGTEAGQFSALTVGGGVSLDGGTLDIETVNGFTLSAGESFPILAGAPGALSGTFAAIDLNGTRAAAGGTIDLGDNTRFETVYNDARGTVTLAVVTPLQPAQATVSPAAVDLGAAHVGASLVGPLTVENTATAPAAFLDASVGGVGGAVTAAGATTLIAPGQTSSGAITAAITAGTAGPRSGAVTIDLTSDPDNDSALLPLPSQTVTVAGVFYRDATATLTAPTNLIVHVGDQGTMTLTAFNGAPADGYSEDLTAALAGVTGGFTASGGATGDIGPGATGTLTATYTTQQAGVMSGAATIDIASDGGSGPNSIDGLGTTELAPVVVPLAVTIDNAARPAFELLSGPGTIDGGGGAFTLDLGTIAQDSAPLAVELGILNDASGPTDLLSGGITATGGFATSGLAAFTDLAAGQADIAPGLTLDTSTTGPITETLTLDPVGGNASGYVASLPPQTLSVVADVAASGTGQPVSTGGAASGSGQPVATRGAGNTGSVTVGGAASGTATVLGPHGTIEMIAFGSPTLAALATQLLALTDEAKTYFITAAGYSALAPAKTAAVITAAGNVTLLGNGAANEVIVAGNGGFDFTAGTGSGTVVAGTGNDLIDDPSRGGDWSMTLGGGVDTVVATGGNDTIATGTGGSLVFLGAGASSVASSGADTVIGSTGAATVSPSANNALVFALGGPLYFIGGGGASTVVAGAEAATLFGGASGGSLAFSDGATQFTGAGAIDTVVGLAGSLSVTGGAGGGLYFGGTAGDNQITAGSGNVTAFGGGAGDVLTATGAASDLFAGGTGAETLSGAGSSGTNTFFAGFGPETLIGGSGETALVAGAGADLMTEGGGVTLFLFVDGRTAGASDTIAGWDPTHDFVMLAGYSGDEASTVMNATVANGSATIALSDGTQVTFAGVTQLNPASFT